jgi:hypothetical protein
MAPPATCTNPYAACTLLQASCSNQLLTHLSPCSKVSIPLDLAADCLASLRDKLYGAADLAQGFRSPPLVRFVAGEQAYLSPTSGGPRMYINLEDYVSGATHKVNQQFQVGGVGGWACSVVWGGAWQAGTGVRWLRLAVWRDWG